MIDWGHDERDFTSGHPERAKRLEQAQWEQLMDHIREICDHAAKFGVRVVVHPHAGGYIEFADEIEKLTEDIPMRRQACAWIRDTCTMLEWIR